MKIRLMVLSAGNSAGKTLPINVPEFVIGRDPQCNLRPASDATISKRHCSATSFAVANDATVIAAATTGRMWTIDYVNGRIGADFNDPIAKVKTPLNSPIVVGPDGKCFAVGVAVELLTSYGIRIYDMASKKPLHSFVGHRGPVSAIHFSPDGNSVASGAQDTSVILWDLSKLPKDR